MADFVFNVAKGRGVEYYNRVKANDPTNSAFIVVILQATGLEADATLRDYLILSTLLAAANDEPTNVGYARKTLDDTALSAFPAPDLVNDRYDVDLPDIVWTAVAAAGGTWAKLLVCYDNDTTGGTDANVIPVSAHDFVITPDGSDIQATINAAGFLRAA